MDDFDRPAPQLSDMAIGSVDTLREQEINQSMIPNTWNDKPPLLDKVDPNNSGKVIKETERLLKGMLRHGIPPPLRCAIQISNIIQAVHPHNSPNYWYEYRTLAKVRILDNAYDCLLQRIVHPTESEQQQRQQQQSDDHDDTEKEGVSSTAMKDVDEDYWKNIKASNYGRTGDDITDNIIPGVTERGKLAYTRVLTALEQILCSEHAYAPLIPVLVCILLTSMSESYAFTCLREMSQLGSINFYFPLTKMEHMSWCCAFADVLRKLHPQTAEYLEDRNVLEVDGLAPIFRDFFIGILPFQYVQRIMDIYTLEGSKVIFRFGVALLVLYKKESAEQLITISRNDEWWFTLKAWTHSKRFNFEFLVRKAYGVHGRGFRRQMRFPRRVILQRIIKMEEERIRNDENLNDSTGAYQDPPARPLGLVYRPAPSVLEEEVKPVLATDVDARQHIAQWLPLTLRLTNLDLLYSTNYHGRTIERFYSHVHDYKHTILLCEVLSSGGGGDATTQEPYVVGMYASQAWRPSTQVYGDGACFLLRLQPDAQCWKWQPRRTSTSGNPLDHEDLESDESSSNRTALLEQFMVSTRTYMSMGGNPDGSCGLRINEDLTRGESSTAVGFDNEPLHGKDRGSVFEIGLLEVYGLVRQIDGRKV